MLNKIMLFCAEGKKSLLLRSKEILIKQIVYMYLKTKFLFKNKERTESSIIVSLSKIRLGTEF